MTCSTGFCQQIVFDAKTVLTFHQNYYNCSNEQIPLLPKTSLHDKGKSKNLKCKNCQGHSVKKCWIYIL